MKKEFLLLIALAFFVLGYVLDYLAGPVSIALKEANPFIFLSRDYLNNYPLTALAVIIRAVGLFISLILLFATVEKHYAAKSLTTLIIGVIAELYAIQQIATGMRTTSLQWTLSIAYAGVSLIVLIVYFLFAAMAHFIRQKFFYDESYYQEPKENEQSN